MATGDSGGSSELRNRKKRGCSGSCTKSEFLPEPSFESWSNYVSALREVPNRLMDRITTRSLDTTEIHEMKAQSHHEMKKSLNWWDLMWFGIGAVIGAGIFVLTGLEAKQDAGPAVVLSYVISGVSAMLSVFCYTEFAVEIPVAGGSFAYLRVELGDFVAFIAAGNILLEYIIGGAAVARSWTSYFATLCNRKPDDFRIIAHNLSKDYNHLDPVAIGVCAVICVIAVLSTKGSSRFNYIFSIIHIFVIAFIIIAGLTKADISNISTSFVPFGAHGIFQASAVLFFAYIGFDAVSTMAEETKNPGKDIPIGLVGSMVVCTLAYCLMAITLCLMQNYKEIDPDAPFSVAFEKVGMGWAKYIVAFGALKGMTTVLLVSAVGQARYLTHIARTHMMPPWFAHVNEKTGTPVNATVAMMSATGIVAFFTKLEILSNLLSISTLFIFMLVAVALIIRRYYASGETTRTNRNKMVGFIVLILVSAIATSIYWGTSKGWIGYVVTVPIWFLATLGLRVLVPQAREPKVWGVPLVPWLPSASIIINIFLLGSIDKDSFIRFGIWTLLLLVYYIFFGLHASYDTSVAARMEKNKAAQITLDKVEEGKSVDDAGAAE